eukprot:TRINITY_DN10468_c0_g1_i5.p1 TRINITY_DN10468_c0_g1~~TRINITY_DN10468_c0_g1_i5.p1  ORF type:complete len:139 (-),score=13.24 TRINITY_DN10468_c0_g1_i5:184-600(-)
MKLLLVFLLATAVFAKPIEKKSQALEDSNTFADFASGFLVGIGESGSYLVLILCQSGWNGLVSDILDFARATNANYEIVLPGCMAKFLVVCINIKNKFTNCAMTLSRLKLFFDLASTPPSLNSQPDSPPTGTQSCTTF